MRSQKLNAAAGIEMGAEPAGQAKASDFLLVAPCSAEPRAAQDYR